MSTVNVSVLVVEDDAPLREALIDTLRAAGATVTFDDMRQLPGLIRQIDQKPGLIAGFSAP